MFFSMSVFIEHLRLCNAQRVLKYLELVVFFLLIHVHSLNTDAIFCIQCVLECFELILVGFIKY
jgi:hypothetical protein